MAVSFSFAAIYDLRLKQDQIMTTDQSLAPWTNVWPMATSFVEGGPQPAAASQRAQASTHPREGLLRLVNVATGRTLVRKHGVTPISVLFISLELQIIWRAAVRRRLSAYSLIFALSASRKGVFTML